MGASLALEVGLKGRQVILGGQTFLKQGRVFDESNKMAIWGPAIFVP